MRAIDQPRARGLSAPTEPSCDPGKGAVEMGDIVTGQFKLTLEMPGERRNAPRIAAGIGIGDDFGARTFEQVRLRLRAQHGDGLIGGSLERQQGLQISRRPALEGLDEM